MNKALSILTISLLCSPMAVAEVYKSTIDDDKVNTTNIQSADASLKTRTKRPHPITPSGDVQFGKVTVTPIPKEQSNTAIENSTFTTTQLDQHSLRRSANCEKNEASRQLGMAVVLLQDTAYTIPTKASALPPIQNTSSNNDVHGMDINKNCVRDDVEHLIFDMYPKKSHQDIRSHLYKQAIWLNFSLIKDISTKSIKVIQMQILRAGLCLYRDLEHNAAINAENRIFARIHNTDERTTRYFENKTKLAGFDVDRNTTPDC